MTLTEAIAYCTSSSSNGFRHPQMPKERTFAPCAFLAERHWLMCLDGDEKVMYQVWMENLSVRDVIRTDYRTMVLSTPQRAHLEKLFSDPWDATKRRYKLPTGKGTSTCDSAAGPTGPAKQVPESDLPVTSVSQSPASPLAVDQEDEHLF